MPNLHRRLALPVALLAPLLLATGCATGTRLGPQKVLASTPDSIQIEWDRWQISERAVRSTAVLHCNGRPVQEVDAGEKPNTLGLIRNKTWRCVGT